MEKQVKEWFDDQDEIKAWAMKCIGHFLEQLKSERDSFKIEAHLYTIMRTAENGYQKTNRLNNRRYSYGKMS